MTRNSRTPVLAFQSTRQQGVALVVGLIFLLITTLIAVTAMSGVVMQERMAGNLRNTSIAFAGAESAARAGELYLRELISRGEDITGNCAGSGAARLFNRDGCTQAQLNAVQNFRTNKHWSGSPGWVHELPTDMISDDELGDPDGGSMSARPLFMIEYLGSYSAIGGTGGEWLSGSGRYCSEVGCFVPNVYRVTGRGQGISVNISRAVDVQFAAFVGAGEP